MTIKKKTRLTKFELEIMNFLWEMGRASIREVQEQYPEKKRPAYTTVQTIVYRLETKGAVRRVKKIGNAHIFEPLVTQQAAYRKVIEDLLSYFGNSVRPLLSHLAENNRVTADDLRYLSEQVKADGKGAAKTSATDNGGRKVAKKA